MNNLDTNESAKPASGAKKERHACVAIFDSMKDVGDALKSLKNDGFDMSLVSVAGPGTRSDNHPSRLRRTGWRWKLVVHSNTFWKGLAVGLVGTGVLLAPEFGPVWVGGPLVDNIVTGMSSAAIVVGVGKIGLGLMGLDIPKENARHYESLLKGNETLMIVHGPVEQVAFAMEKLEDSEAREIVFHSNW